MRLVKVFAVTHVIALFLIPIVFVLALGYLISEPAVEIGSFMFTCSSQAMADGTEIAGCFWSWK